MTLNFPRDKIFLFLGLPGGRLVKGGISSPLKALPISPFPTNGTQ